MSATSMAKTQDEVYLDLWAQYREENPGPKSAEAFGRWIHNKQLLPNPTVDPARIHARKAKQALRRKRTHDLKGRKIRPWLAIKIEKMTANGQTVMEVIWDHIHEMSLDHALSTFEQRDEVITKGRKRNDCRLSLRKRTFFSGAKGDSATVIPAPVLSSGAQQLATC